MGDLTIIFFGRLISVLVSLIALRISTGVLPQEEYTSLILMITCQNLGSLVFAGPFGAYMQRMFNENKEHGCIRRLQKQYSQICFCGALILAVISKLVVGLDLIPTAIISFFAYIFSMNTLLVSFYNLDGKRKESVILNISTVTLGLIFSFGCIQIEPTSTLWLVGQCLAAAIVYLWGMFTAPVRWECNKNAQNTTISMDKLQVFILPLIFINFMVWFLTHFYKIYLNWFISSYELAMLLLGFTLASQLISVAENIISQYLYPIFLKKISDDNQETNEAFFTLVNLAGPIYLLLVAAGIFCCDVLLAWLVDEKYAAARNYLILGFVFEFVRTINMLLSTFSYVSLSNLKILKFYSISSIVLTILFYGFFISESVDLNLVVLSLVLCGLIITFCLIRYLVKFSGAYIDSWSWSVTVLIFIMLLLFSKFEFYQVGNFTSQLLKLTCSAAAVVTLVCIHIKSNKAYLKFLSYKMS